MWSVGQKELEISYRDHRPVTLIYQGSDGAISQRVVRVTELTEDGIRAYCMTKRQPRTFLAERILAASLQVPRGASTTPTGRGARPRVFG